jgi:hypothetical protein
MPLESSLVKNELQINKDVDNQDAKAEQKMILPTDTWYT